jgi:DNA-binding CsgD family transcriptional regulator/tetratricopeptide (TPR) repeat protein
LTVAALRRYGYQVFTATRTLNRGVANPVLFSVTTLTAPPVSPRMRGRKEESQVAGAGKRAPQLIGRAQELAEIDRGLDRLAAGRPWFVQIMGEPGIGKSRLLQELATRANARGFLVLTGRAAEFEQDLPFAMLRDACDEYLGHVSAAGLRPLRPETLAELRQVFPSLSRVVDGAAMPATAAGADRYRTHHAIRELLELLASRRPVVVALDDVHWADAASVEVAAALLNRFRGPLLGAFATRRRPTRLGAVFDTLARSGYGEQIDLSPLTAAEADTLMDPSLDVERRGLLYRQSGGNPFYLEQLSRSAAPTDTRFDTAVGDVGGVWRPPAAVSASIRGELTALSSTTRAVVDAAAIAGESFEPRLVAAIAGRPEESTLDAFDELLTVDLVRPTDAPARFRFRHPIVRRLVYDELPRAWRIGAHARAATALLARHAPVTEAALHIERSASVGDAEAVETLIDAAHTLAPRAPLTAGRWLRTALRLLPHDVDPARRFGLLVDAASALASAGADEESVEELTQALQVVPSSEPVARAELIAKLSEARRRSGQPFASRELLSSALSSLDERAPERVRVAVRVELAIDHIWHREWEDAQRLAEVVLAAGADDSVVALAAALRSLAASAQLRTGEANRCLAVASQALERLSDDQLAQRVYLGVYVGTAALRVEQLDQVLAHLHRCLRVARATGQDTMVNPWLSTTASALLLNGDLAAARSDAAAAAQTTLLPAENWRTVWALEADAMAAYWAGDAERAMGSATDMVARSGRSADRFLEPTAAVQLGGALLLSGDAAAAATELSALDDPPTRDILDRHAGFGWELLTRAYLALGDKEATDDVSARSLQRAELAGLPRWQCTARIARASARLLQDDLAAALSLAGDAVTIAHPLDNPLLLARARLMLGRAHAASGDRAAAVAELSAAESGLLGCGAMREADAAARELRRLGQRVARRVRPGSALGLDALSNREREVAAMVATGRTNKDIAGALFLSEKTIESHLARIYTKLDVHSRAALTALLARAGS